MEIMQLRYLKEVARQESFTRAAELLHITQSALSKSIAKLEDEVGVKLFERDGNRIHLNPFGKAILRSSDQALVDLENGLKQVREMAGLEQGTVRVGVGPEVFIKHLVKDFLLRHPNVYDLSASLPGTDDGQSGSGNDGLCRDHRSCDGQRHQLGADLFGRADGAHV